MRVAALDEDVALIRDLECLARVLLDHQDRNAGAGNLDDPVEKLVHDDGADARRRFVEHQNLGFRHQRAVGGDLLALPA